MKSGEARVGILLLLGGTAVMLVLLVVLARYPSLFLRGDEYRAIFENAAGLNEGDQVRYGGILVGTVTGLDFHEADPTRIVIRFRVRTETPVRADTRAQVSQLGLLGEPYLSLIAGSADAPPLLEGSFLPTEPTMSFGDAISRLASFFDRADTLLTGVERIARSEPWERIERTLARTEELIAGTAASSERLFAQLERASGRLNVVLDRTDRLVVAVDTAFRTNVPALGNMQREARATIRDMSILIGQLRAGVNAGGGLDEIMRNIAVTSENLANITETLEREPASLFRSREQPRKVVGPRIRD